MQGLEFSSLGVHNATVDQWRFGRPWELDPLIGALPHVLTLDERLRLFIQTRRADITDHVGAEIVDMSQRVARVGNVVDDQHLRIGEVKLVEVGPVSYTHSPSPRDQRGSRMPSSA